MDAYNQDFAIGADLSLLKRNLDHGAVYRAGHQVVQPASFFRQCGFTWARLRLFHTPTGRGAQCTDLPYTVELARLLKAAGFKLLLDLHYSDTWADPAKQFTPSAWLGLDSASLEKAVYEYTLDVIGGFVREGVGPDMVQVGNEITPGMLWEHGRIAEAHDTNSLHWHRDPSSNNRDAWHRFGRLLKAGIQGVYDTAGPSTEIMIHIDRGGDIPTNQWFFDNLSEQAVEFDAIGESYYPFWHGMPEDLAETLSFLGTRYGKDIYLAEVAYPHRHHAMYEHALSGDHEGWERLTGQYPLSPEKS
jgi:arabinogalactan endo-1,4-beta-galactosidase